eukprot:PhM_4_TR3017/c2_g5_i3/m.89411
MGTMAFKPGQIIRPRPVGGRDDPGDDDELADFRASQASPLLAGSKAGHVVQGIRASLSETPTAHRLTQAGLSADTRKQHVRFLREFASTATEELLQRPLARAVLEWLEQKRQLSRLSFTTFDQQMGNAAGAFKRLPQYTQDALPSIQLSVDQQWKDAQRAVKHFASLESSPTRPTMSKDGAQATISRLDHDVAMQMFLCVMWACAARPGDVLQLKRANVQVHSSQQGNTATSALFNEGKVLKTIDPYTVHTVLPDPWAAKLRSFISSSSSSYLFDLPTLAARTQFLKQARLEVRVTNPLYDLRAVRRGAAQALAADGISLSTVMLFTRHATVGMLRRYLGFGQAKSEEASKATAAASVLWPTRC